MTKQIDFSRYEHFVDAVTSDASKEISEIKSIKSGYSVEKNFEDYFPSEFVGKFNWERSEVEQVFDSIKFESLKRLGINNYLLKA